MADSLTTSRSWRVSQEGELTNEHGCQPLVTALRPKGAPLPVCLPRATVRLNSTCRGLHSALAQTRQAVVQLKKFRTPATATLMSVLLGCKFRVVNLCSWNLINSSGATLK